MSSYSVAGLLVIAFAVSSLNGTVSSSSRSTLDKCVRLDIRVVHSQKAYFNGVDQNRTTVPKVGPKGEKGERGLRGIVGPKGGKGSTGDDSGIKQLENRLAEAEQLITELMAFKGNITEKGGCFFNIFKSCKAALEVGCSGDGIFHLQPKRGQSVFKVRQTFIKVHLLSKLLLTQMFFINVQKNTMSCSLLRHKVVFYN